MLEEYPEVMTLDEVSKVLRVTKGSLKNSRRSYDKALKPVRINDRGDRRYLKENVLAYLEKKI